MLTFVLPVFVSVTVCAALLLPMVIFPKLNDVGLAERFKTGATPVPLIGILVGELAVLTLTAPKFNDYGLTPIPA
jgi:hypothetical protein